EIGKGNLLREGADVTVIASGIMVAEALKAAEMLAAEGISARVVDMFTWKPMDDELVGRCAAETGAIVTAENHNVYGGLGAAVAEALGKTVPAPMEMVGIQDRFGQVGTEDFLRKEYGLTPEEIVAAAKRAIARKAK
ncbi:MAG: transketolase family protein, partial [Oscillospiraceae bacterium]|nr:transketolase family protein [Oscillospiraceae bacterium]